MVDDRRRVTAPEYQVSSPSQYMARRVPAARSGDGGDGEADGEADAVGAGVDCGAGQAIDIGTGG